MSEDRSRGVMTASPILQPGRGKELGYHPFWEDTPVTLQVALVGTDGIVLASDKRTVYLDEVTTSGTTSKILVDESGSFALAYAGHEISQVIARRILEKPALLESRGPLIELEKLAEAIYKEQITEDSQDFRTDSQLLIVQRKDLSRFHVLHMNRKKWLSEPRADKAIIGHATNTACFFTEEYYSKAPVAALKLLAAHTIIAAAKRNPSGIEGLEILVCTPEKFEFAALHEIPVLEKRSRDIDDQLRHLLAAPNE
jgi:hypothetical protein